MQRARSQYQREVGGFGHVGIAHVDDAAGSDAVLHHRRAYDLIVEHDSDEIANVLGSEVREAPTTRPIEHLSLVEIRRILQHVPGYERISFRDVQAAVGPLPETDQLRFPMERHVPRQSTLHLGQSEKKSGNLHVFRSYEIRAFNVSRSE